MFQALLQCLGVGDSFAALFMGEAERLRHAYYCGYIFGAGPLLTLLAPARQQRLERHAVTQDQQSNSLGSIKLVCRERERVHAPFGKTHGKNADSLNRIRMHWDASCPADRCDFHTGSIVPISLFTAMTETSTVSPERGGFHSLWV